MIIKVMIRTPKGEAEKAEKRIREFVLGVKRRKVNIINHYVNKANSRMIWEIEAPIRDCLRIQKNVARFDTVMKTVFSSKMVKKQLRKNFGMTDDKEKELQTLFDNQTKVDIIKQATADEIVEENKTWWQKVKETYIKK